MTSFSSVSSSTALPAYCESAFTAASTSASTSLLIRASGTSACGDFPTGDETDVWSSSDDGDTWSVKTASAPWAARNSAYLAYMNGSLFIGAGTSRGAHYMNDEWVSTDLGASWTLCTTAASFSPRYYVSGAIVVVTNNTVSANMAMAMVMAGGWTTTGAVNDVWTRTSSAVTASWQLVTASAPWAPRCFHSLLLLQSSSQLLLIGGAYSPGDSAYYFNDVWLSQDGGRAWTNKGNAPTQPGFYQGSAVAVGEVVYVICPAGTTDVYKTEDYGTSWESITSVSGLVTDTGAIWSVSPSPSTHLVVLSPASTGTVYASTITDSSASGAGGVTGDPVLVGWFGQKYQVHGVPGRWMTIVTMARVQFSALFTFLHKPITMLTADSVKHDEHHPLHHHHHHNLRRTPHNQHQHQHQHRRRESVRFTHPGTYLTKVSMKIRSTCAPRRLINFVRKVSTSNERDWCENRLMIEVGAGGLKVNVNDEPLSLHTSSSRCLYLNDSVTRTSICMPHDRDEDEQVHDSMILSVRSRWLDVTFVQSIDRFINIENAKLHLKHIQIDKQHRIMRGRNNLNVKLDDNDNEHQFAIQEIHGLLGVSAHGHAITPLTMLAKHPMDDYVEANNDPFGDEFAVDRYKVK